MKHKKFYIRFLICVIACLCVAYLLTANSGKKNTENGIKNGEEYEEGDNYGDKPGVAEGKIDFSSEIPDVTISNIEAEVGEDIDFLTYIEVLNSEKFDKVQIWVNTTEVLWEEPGTYPVIYTIEYDDEEIDKKIKLTLIETKGTETSSHGETDQSDPAHKNDDETLSADQPTASPNDTETPNNTEEGTVNDRPIDVSIILLSGETVRISCSLTNRIESTRTDVETVEIKGIKYEVKKLIITFNTGKERVLETVHKKL